MKKPSVQQWDHPSHINEYPETICFKAGHLISDNASWRSSLPSINTNRCKNCGICYLVCPEGAVDKKDGYSIDPVFCKGCGICVRECRFNAITQEVNR